MSTTSVTDDETCVLALILSVYIIMSFDFPFVRLFGVRNFVITFIEQVMLNLNCFVSAGGMSCNREVLCGGIIEDS